MASRCAESSNRHRRHRSESHSAVCYEWRRQDGQRGDGTQVCGGGGTAEQHAERTQERRQRRLPLHVVRIRTVDARSHTYAEHLGTPAHRRCRIHGEATGQQGTRKSSNLGASRQPSSSSLLSLSCFYSTDVQSRQDARTRGACVRFGRSGILRHDARLVRHNTEQSSRGNESAASISHTRSRTPFAPCSSDITKAKFLHGVGTKTPGRVTLHQSCACMRDPLLTVARDSLWVSAALSRGALLDDNVRSRIPRRSAQSARIGIQVLHGRGKL